MKTCYERATNFFLSAVDNYYSAWWGEVPVTSGKGKTGAGEYLILHAFSCISR